VREKEETRGRKEINLVEKKILSLILPLANARSDNK
jgi:hypothetical protein